MADQQQVENYRNALAFAQAYRAEDEEGAKAVYGMVPESERENFVRAMAKLVELAFRCHPGAGWEGFSAMCSVSLDQVEAQVQPEKAHKNPIRRRPEGNMDSN